MVVKRVLSMSFSIYCDGRNRTFGGFGGGRTMGMVDFDNRTMCINDTGSSPLDLQ